MTLGLFLVWERVYGGFKDMWEVFQPTATFAAMCQTRLNRDDQTV